MTNKEWKELCEWAKTQKYKVVEFNQQEGDSEEEYLLEVNEDYIAIEDYGLEFDKVGDIWSYENLVAENRTPAQMKAIIENLL